MRYAAHALRIGKYHYPYPLITPLGAGRFAVEPFTHETHSTVFYNDTLVLSADGYLPSDTTATSLSLDELRTLIDSRSDWRLILPE